MSYEPREFKFPVSLSRTDPPQPIRPERETVPRLQGLEGADIWAPDAPRVFLPKGLVSVIDGFERIGTANFGEEWTGAEGAYRGNFAPFPRPRAVFFRDSDVIADLDAYKRGHTTAASLLRINLPQRMGPLTNSEWCAATDCWQMYESQGAKLIARRKAVVDIIHRALADGELKAIICADDGDPVRVRETAWNCQREEAWRRFRTGYLSFIHGFAKRLAFPRIFFFDGITLENFLAQFSQSPKRERSIGQRKPFSRFSSDTEISDWYKARLSHAPVRGFSREDDVAAGKAVGISRDRIRWVRGQCAPSEWSKGGPRSN